MSEEINKSVAGRIKVGDTVRLGCCKDQLMTVRDVVRYDAMPTTCYECSWISQNGELHRGEFLEWELEHCYAR